MKVICPKCQFENQADTKRVVCARCATIIDVSTDEGAGTDANGRTAASRLPFSSSSGNSQPLSNKNQSGQPGNKPQDVYATRIGDDFDDVLDIPRPSQSSYETNYEASPVFDDIFNTPSYETSDPYEYAPGPRSSNPGMDYDVDSTRQRETQGYVDNPEPEFMGWPVLPENTIDEDDDAGGFSTNRGGLLARIVLSAIVFGGLVFCAYYFLGEFISQRKEQGQSLVDNSLQTQGQANQAGGGAGGAASVAANTSASKPAAVDSNTNTTPPPTQPASSGQPTAARGDSQPAQAAGKPVDIPPMTGRAGHSSATKSGSPMSVPTSGNLTIQVASFNDQSQANDRAARLKSAGVDARVVRAEIPGKGTWYRVQIGGFNSRDEASRFGNQLRSKGVVQEFIVTSIGK